jgi:hypothetical protein
MSFTESSPNVLAIKINENTEKNFIVFCVAFLLSSLILLHCKDVSFLFFQSASAQERSRAEVNNLHKRLHLVLSLSQIEEARRRS